MDERRGQNGSEGHVALFEKVREQEQQTRDYSVVSRGCDRMAKTRLDDRLQSPRVRSSEIRCFFFAPREKLAFTIRPVDRSTWRFFSKYHYLSERLPGGKILTFGLFHNDDQIGFQCFANYTPHRAGQKEIYHSNRTVVHPDFQGLGLGIKIINETSAYVKHALGFRVMAKFSSLPVYKAMIRQTQWRFLGERRLMGKMQRGGTMLRKGGFREYGIKTYHFEFVG